MNLHQRLERALARSMRETAPTGERYEHRTYAAGRVMDDRIKQAQQERIERSDLFSRSDWRKQRARPLGVTQMYTATPGFEAMVRRTVHATKAMRLHRILDKHMRRHGVTVVDIKLVGGVWWATAEHGLLSFPMELPVPVLLKSVARS